MSHRVSVARGSGPTGAGLGNEVIAWAKAYIAARELGLRLALPLWSLNRYRLYEEFGWSRAQMLASTVGSWMPPRVLISETRFRETGECDYGAAMKVIDRELALSERRAITVVHEGMWGGYLAIRTARAFLHAAVMGAPGVVQSLHSLGLPSDEALIVAVHVRLGDFAHGAPGPGQFNRSIPMAWYAQVIDHIREVAPEHKVRILLFSNAPAAQLAPLLRIPGTESVTRAPAMGGKAIHDLAAMISADLLVCSISSFSMLAAFLSGRHYLWFGDQLTPIANGLSLWGDEPAQQGNSGPTAINTRSLRSGERGRGVPIYNDGTFPAWLSDFLRHVSAIRRPDRDILTYGVVHKDSDLRQWRHERGFDQG